jgi:hypothetical protein
MSDNHFRVADNTSEVLGTENGEAAAAAYGR